MRRTSCSSALVRSKSSEEAFWFRTRITVGEGIEDGSDLVTAWQEHAPDATLLVERDDLQVNEQSFRAWRSLLREHRAEPT